MNVIFTDDIFASSDDADPEPPVSTGRRGRRPGPAGDVVTQLRPEQTTVTVLQPWRVVDHIGNVYVAGDTPTVPQALADEWIRNQWATPAR